jgi:hypothetical protein
VFENRVLRRIFQPEREEVAEVGEICVMGSFIIYAVRYIGLLLG